MMPRSLRSTSWRFSRSCLPIRMRLRSSNRNRAEALTSSTPRLVLRGTENPTRFHGEGLPDSPTSQDAPFPKPLWPQSRSVQPLGARDVLGWGQSLQDPAYLPAGWPPLQHKSSSTASSMREAPGQWKQERRLLRCRKLLLHAS